MDKSPTNQYQERVKLLYSRYRLMRANGELVVYASGSLTVYRRDGTALLVAKADNEQSIRNLEVYVRSKVRGV